MYEIYLQAIYSLRDYSQDWPNRQTGVKLQKEGVNTPTCCRGKRRRRICPNGVMELAACRYSGLSPTAISIQIIDCCNPSSFAQGFLYPQMYWHHGRGGQDPYTFPSLLWDVRPSLCCLYFFVVVGGCGEKSGTMVRGVHRQSWVWWTKTEKGLEACLHAGFDVWVQGGWLLSPMGFRRPGA